MCRVDTSQLVRVLRKASRDIIHEAVRWGVNWGEAADCVCVDSIRKLLPIYYSQKLIESWSTMKKETHHVFDVSFSNFLSAGHIQLCNEDGEIEIFCLKESNTIDTWCIVI